MSAMLRRWSRGMHALALLVAVTVVATTTYALWPERSTRRVVADFPRAIGLYAGSDVRVLGVPIGRVDRVVPRGDVVRVEMSYDARHKIPADAQAVIVAPSIVSDRYVQLTPVYRGGPVLPDGARIPVDRTAVPVELDRIYESLDDLAVALGPQGANKDGALSRALRVGAANLDGQGARLRGTIGDLAEASETLAAGREDLFATVRQLRRFTSTLAASDEQVRRFNADLAAVAEQLAGEREDLEAALDNLAVALTELSSFVRENRDELRANVDDLTELSRTLVKQQEALREVLDTAPVALANLDRTYNPRTGTLDTRDNFAQLDDPGLYLCSLLEQAGESRALCELLRTVLDDLPLPEVPGGPAGTTSETSPGPDRDARQGGSHRSGREGRR